MKSPSPKLWWLTKKTGVSSIFPSLSGAPQIFSLQKSVEAKIEIGLVPIGRGVSGFSTKSQILQLFYEGPHVLVHLLKSLRANIVKSSSTLFSDNVQLNLEISFSYARFNSLLGYNLLTKSWDHHKWNFSDPCIEKLKNTLSNVIYFFEKH